MQRRIALLGSTGSIGVSTLDVAACLPQRVRPVALAAHRNWRVLAEQAHRFHVPFIAIADEAHYAELRGVCVNGTQVLAGRDGLLELVDRSGADFVMSAIVGAAGLPATLAAVHRGVDVGIANKESLVIAGSVLMPLAQRTGARLIPVDSEHSAIFQCLHSGKPEDLKRIYLTASGGPFRTWDAARIAAATLDDALRHPTWSMGPKITIDSATMMNKALEVIEAHWLFGLGAEQIEVLVHPESIVHSMVEFRDGSIIAQLGSPDMRTPIQYALTYPERDACSAPAMDWSAARTLTFEPPDHARFPSLRLGFEAARAGGTSGAVLNAANEAAVDAFRAGRASFSRMSAATEEVFRRHAPQASPTLEQLLAADAWARHEVEACLSN